ncbi:MAG: MEKHLA domain-containing protein [Nitrospiraceae bacterium]
MISPRGWQDSKCVTWCQLLIDSFRHWTGRDLIDRRGTAEDQAKLLFTASFVVVSHGTEDDPVLNYGNQTALDLWEMTWEELTSTPSRLTVEPTARNDRERMLTQATTHGYIDDYRGVRISKTGRRFLVEQAIVWNVLDHARQRCGQAATFTHWTFLQEPDA